MVVYGCMKDWGVRARRDVLGADARVLKLGASTENASGVVLEAPLEVEGATVRVAHLQRDVAAKHGGKQVTGERISAR